MPVSPADIQVALEVIVLQLQSEVFFCFQVGYELQPKFTAMASSIRGVKLMTFS